jgi:hypothetical protein
VLDGYTEFYLAYFVLVLISEIKKLIFMTLKFSFEGFRSNDQNAQVVREKRKKKFKIILPDLELKFSYFLKVLRSTANSEAEQSRV